MSRATVALSLKVPKPIAPAFGAYIEKVDSNFAHVSLPIGFAFVALFVWLVVGALVRRQAKPRWGEVKDDTGMPLWRCSTGLHTQLLVFPLLFVLSWARAGYSIESWERLAGERLFTYDGARYYDWAFVYIFAGFMVEDLILLQLGRTMTLHHIGCLLGLAVAFVGMPASFPYFFAGVVSFELGSALFNLHTLYPRSRAAMWTYVVGMTLSNLCTFLIMCRSLYAEGGVVGKAFGAVLTAIFALVRQQSAVESFNTHVISSPRPARRSLPQGEAFLKASAKAKAA